MRGFAISHLYFSDFRHWILEFGFRVKKSIESRLLIIAGNYWKKLMCPILDIHGYLAYINWYFDLKIICIIKFVTDLVLCICTSSWFWVNLILLATMIFELLSSQPQSGFKTIKIEYFSYIYVLLLAELCPLDIPNWWKH